jgi:hypothetical protein
MTVEKNYQIIVRPPRTKPSSGGLKRVVKVFHWKNNRDSNAELPGFPLKKKIEFSKLAHRNEHHRDWKLRDLGGCSSKRRDGGLDG